MDENDTSGMLGADPAQVNPTGMVQTLQNQQDTAPGVPDPNMAAQPQQLGQDAPSPLPVNTLEKTAPSYKEGGNVENLEPMPPAQEALPEQPQPYKMPDLNLINNSDPEDFDPEGTSLDTMIVVHMQHDEMTALDKLQGGRFLDDELKIPEYRRLVPMVGTPEMMQVLGEVLEEIAQTGKISAETKKFIGKLDPLFPLTKQYGESNEQEESGQGMPYEEEQELAAQGEGGDDSLAYIPLGLANVLDEIRGETQTNPRTGLPEYGKRKRGFFRKAFNFIAPIATTILTGNPFAGAAVGAGLGATGGGGVKGALTGAATGYFGGSGAQGLLAGGVRGIGTGMGMAANSLGINNGIAGLVGALHIANNYWGASEYNKQVRREHQRAEAERNKWNERELQKDRDTYNALGGVPHKESVPEMAPMDPLQPVNGYVPNYYNHLKGGGTVHEKGKTPKVEIPALRRTGIVKGPGDGQEDVIATNAPEGTFILRAETVADAGNGSSSAGARLLDKFFANLRNGEWHEEKNDHEHLPHEDVPIWISNEEYPVMPEDVKILGEGDPNLGTKLLKNLQKNLSLHKASNGAKLSPKTKALEVYMRG